MIFLHNDSAIRRFRLTFRVFARVTAALLITCSFVAASSPLARAQAAPPTKFPVSIVLPPRLVAGQSGTLAVLDADGRLAPDVTVELGPEQNTNQAKVQRVTTDITGRAFFTAPSQGGVIFARVLGATSVGIVESASSIAKQGITVQTFISQRDPFSICGAAFRGDADANSVRLNDEPGLILAASPQCLVVLAGPKAKPGLTQIVVDAGAVHAAASTTLVSLDSEPPNPPLAPGKKSFMTVRVEGSDRALAIVVENKTPGVLRFLRGDEQQSRTSGGSVNRVQIEVEALRSGDFSFHARLASVPDADSARRYLEAALPLAPKDSQSTIKKLADRLTHHQSDIEKVRRELDKILSSAIAGDSRALLEAARAAL
jgi:hypothetical protein